MYTSSTKSQWINTLLTSICRKDHWSVRASVNIIRIVWGLTTGLNVYWKSNPGFCSKTSSYKSGFETLHIFIMFLFYFEEPFAVDWVSTSREWNQRPGVIINKSIQLFFYDSDPTWRLHSIMNVCWFCDSGQGFFRDGSSQGVLRLGFGACLHGMSVQGGFNRCRWIRLSN